MIEHNTLNVIKRDNKWLLWSGILLTITGILALVCPVTGTFAVNFFVGSVLLFAGVFHLLGSFSIKGTGPFFGALLLSLLTVAAGLFMLRNPLAGVMALTMILAILFIIEGAFHIMLSFELKPADGWGWMFFAGLVNLLIGLFVASGIQQLSLILLGILLGVNFLATGFSFLILYTRLKKIQ